MRAPWAGPAGGTGTSRGEREVPVGCATQSPKRIETIFLSKPIVDRSLTFPVTTFDMPVQSGPVQILIGPPLSSSEEARPGCPTFWQPGPDTPSEPFGSVRLIPLSRMTLPLPRATAAPAAGAEEAGAAGAAGVAGAGGSTLPPVGEIANQVP